MSSNVFACRAIGLPSGEINRAPCTAPVLLPNIWNSDKRDFNAISAVSSMTWQGGSAAKLGMAWVKDSMPHNPQPVAPR